MTEWLVCGSLAALVAALLEVLGFWSLLGLRHVVLTVAIGWCIGAAMSLAVPCRTMLAGAATALAVIVAVIAFTPIIDAPVARWVRADPDSGIRPAAVIVLSSSVESDTTIGRSGADRLLEGLGWARQHGVPRLITTTVVLHAGRRRLTSLPDQQRLVHLAGQDSAWTALDSVANTHDEAVRAASALRVSPAGRMNIAVVTSPMHTRRACATFETAGFRVTCVPALEREHDTWHPATPEDRLAAWQAYVYERFGWVEYRRRGWV